MSISSTSNVMEKTDIRELPIPFSAPMVRALPAGTKTQTRRALRVQPDAHHWESLPGYELKRSKLVTINERIAVKFSHSIPQNQQWDTALDWLLCPYGQPGDRLWVREAWRAKVQFDHEPPRNIPECAPVRYEAAGMHFPDGQWGKYRHARFMCRWMSRTLLEVTEVRVQRLQDITEEDAQAEGIAAHRKGGWWWEQPPAGIEGTNHFGAKTARDAYMALWEQINGAGSWDANPWVWAVSFKRITS